MKILSEKKALERLSKLKENFRGQISKDYEHRAKNCMTCSVQGSCCLDAHFVNVHISRLEAVAIKHALDRLPEEHRQRVYDRIDKSVEEYGLELHGDTYARTYACPLFEKGLGCLVHFDGKPVPCIAHACYDNAADLPPDALQMAEEKRIDALNQNTYGRRHNWLPLPLALRRKL